MSGDTAANLCPRKRTAQPLLRCFLSTNGQGRNELTIVIRGGGVEQRLCPHSPCSILNISEAGAAPPPQKPLRHGRANCTHIVFLEEAKISDGSKPDQKSPCAQRHRAGVVPRLKLKYVFERHVFLPNIKSGWKEFSQSFSLYECDYQPR